MELSVDKQIFEQFKKAGKILIVLPENLTADDLASGMALRLFLNKQQKEVSVVCAAVVPEHLKFLPGSQTVESRLPDGKSLVITLDTSVKKLAELSYEKNAQDVQIYLKSESEPFSSGDLVFSQDKAPFDLIVALGGKSPEAFGRIFQESAKQFFETPKINIDHSPENEYFGSINLVDITATSVAEILAELMQKYEQQLIDEDIATCLLSGIIEKTSSFQHIQTTPKAFMKASELVAMGGRQQEVVKNIFKTKSLPLLKLWGRTLAKMKILESASAVYAVLSHADFEKTGAGPADVLPVLKELADNVSGYKIMVLIYETEKNQASLLLALHPQLLAEKFIQNLQPLEELEFSLAGSRLYRSQIERGLEEWESLLLASIG